MAKCNYGCNRVFQTLSALEDHRRAAHMGMLAVTITKSGMCRYGCNRQFQTLEAMEDHRRASHPDCIPAGPPAVKKRPVAACNDCGRTFSSLEALRNHQLTMLGHIRPAKVFGSFACENCNRTLRSQDSLEQHFVADHSLIRMPEGDSKRAELEEQFLQNWRKPSRPGRILSVYRVYNPTWRAFEFHRHKKQHPQDGNEVPRYHGTTLMCKLGSGSEVGNSKLCQSDCCILRTGFKMVKSRNTWQRFGKGIYTTATSGKSDDYIRSGSSQRAVLVCRVLAGNVFRTKTNMPYLECPPPGYDSVSGEVGEDLNYDETVVYDSKAILPFYMIVYTHD